MANDGGSLHLGRCRFGAATVVFRLIAVVVLLLLVRPARAQQRPTLTLPSFNYSTSHRQSVCGIQQRIDDGNLPLRRALAGLNLTTWLLADGRFFNLDSEGRIDATDPGLIGVLLDELATRGGFAWRDSFGVVDSVLIPDDKTYADLLSWSIWGYDLSAAYWKRSIRRMDLGASFPEGWLDGRIIMVGRRSELEGSGGSASLNLWSFLAPFSWQVWIMIGVTVAISGAVYWFLDWWDNKSDDMQLESDPANNLFLAAISFTGHFEFKPRSNTARLFTASLAFWSLIMMSAYTANLASFLVVRNKPTVNIDTIGDAVRHNYRICVIGKSDTDDFLTHSYAGARIVRVTTEPELYERVTDGTCDVSLPTVSSWDEYRRNRQYNGRCNLDWIGRTVEEGEGGFATQSDSGSKCTSLVRDVLNLHLLEMKAAGVVGKAWEAHYRKHASIDCDANIDAADEGDDSGQLSLQAMGGTFIIHYILTGVAVILSVAWKCHSEERYRRCSMRRRRAEAADADADAVANANGESNGSVVVAKSIGAHADEGFTDEAGLGPSGGSRGSSVLRRRYDEMYQRHNERLADMLVMVEAMKSESSAMRKLLHTSDDDAS